MKRGKIFSALVYPFLMLQGRLKNYRKQVHSQSDNKEPTVTFYSLQARLNNGQAQSFQAYSGKYVLLVNLASFCGYTHQYKELQELYKKYEDKLVILGFPTNDFGDQEPGDDASIALFCQVNYGVTFPLFEKLAVKGPNQQRVYQWLSKPEQNGWNTETPSWNFCKYLVNTKGQLTHFFPPAISPLSDLVTNQLI